jgi:hypothetical protein
MNENEKNEEIWELINIPEVKEFFSSALIEAKEKFKNQIQQHRETKKKLKEEKEQEVVPPGLNELSTGISYFFDIIRTDDPGSDGHRWVVEKFKFKDKPGIVSFIFSDFIKKIDQLEIEPQQIKTYDVPSAAGSSFKINFTKSSDAHVGGFVKKIPPREIKQRMEDSKVIKLSREYEGMDEEEMYQQIIQLMRKNQEVREDIFFYYQMAQLSKK